MTVGLAIAAAVTAGSAAYAANEQANAAENASNAQSASAREAARSAAFTPYAVTTSLGSTQFTNAEQARANQARLDQVNREYRQQREALAAAPPPTSGYGGITSMSFAPPDLQITERYGQRGFIDPNDGKFYQLDAGVNTSNVDPLLRENTQQALGAANSAMGRYTEAANVDPRVAAQQLYEQDRRAIDPQRALEQDRLYAGLQGSGSLGHQVQDGGFRGGPATANDAYNPLAASFARGNAEADYSMYRGAMSESMGRLDSLLRQAGGAQSLLGASRAAETGDIALGSELGGRAASAGANSAQYLNQIGSIQGNAATANARANSQLVNGVVNNENLQRLLGGIGTNNNPSSIPSTRGADWQMDTGSYSGSPGTSLYGFGG
jgi:hypothetical protein